MNHTPLKRLGWLQPSEINSFRDSIRVTEAKESNNISVLKEPSFEEQQQNQKDYELNPKNKFQLHSYVLLDFKETAVFDKSFDVSVKKSSRNFSHFPKNTSETQISANFYFTIFQFCFS